jgi:hypothetical protein
MLVSWSRILNLQNLETSLLNKSSGLVASALDTMFVRINVIKSHIVVLLKSGLDVQQPGLPIKRTSLGAF